MRRTDDAQLWSLGYAPALVGALSLFGLQPFFSACNVGPDFQGPETPVSTSWRSALAETAPESRPRRPGGAPTPGRATDTDTEAEGAAESPITTQAEADSLWWKVFNDPVLDRLVEQAYRQNLSLQVAGLRIAEARAKLGVAFGRQFPQVQELYASGTAISISNNVPIAAALPRRFLDYQLGFDAAWEVDFWGKYRRGVEAEDRSERASVADYDAALVSLTAEVARTYVMARTYAVLIEEARDNVRLQEEAFRIAESRFRNGATSELDPVQAKTLLESTRATIPQEQIGLQQTQNALCTLLGQPAGSLDAMLQGAKEIPKPPPRVAVGVPAEMLRRRPDIRSAELNAAAQSARIGVAKADLYPSLAISGTVGLEATSAGPSANLFSADSFFYNVGPRISWPFFNYGRITNAVRTEDARFQELLVSYHDAVLRAAQEVEDALAGFRRAQQAKAFQQDAVAASRRAVELAMVQYREGAADYLRVVDAQRSLLEQENNLTQTSSSVATNLIAVYKALGGGWELREGQPVVNGHTQAEMKERTSWGDILSQPPPAGSTKSPPPAGH
jgi:NodT family efflux transporter outer membrane factor (OMF) lipoprotein